MKTWLSEENQQRKAAKVCCCISLRPNTDERKIMISFKSKWKGRWDKMILLFAIYNSFTIPLEQAFRPGFLQLQLFQVMDTIIDVLFLLDILLSFFTTYMNKRG